MTAPDIDAIRPLLQPSEQRILLVVVDGIGGMPDADAGTELEAADTPNLDALAARGSVGLSEPAGPGITVGSGPGHLAVFGYDPLEPTHNLGRGLLSALGLGVDLGEGHLAARANLATLADDGTVADRRAGRIGGQEAQALVDRLSAQVRLDGAEVEFRHIAEHRVLVVLRGDGLDPRVVDTDPQATGVPPHQPSAKAPAAEHTAEMIGRLDSAVREALAGERANVLLLRGWEARRALEPFTQRTGLKAACLARYPMYRGVAELVGMDVLDAGEDLAAQVAAVPAALADHDLVFFHHKAPDAAGHDGDRDAKIAELEAFDAALPGLVGALQDGDVLWVTGDHAAPAALSGHSWHPVPTLQAGGAVGRDEVSRFGERWCRTGALGLRPATAFLPLALAAAGRLAKYGA